MTDRVNKTCSKCGAWWFHSYGPNICPHCRPAERATIDPTKICMSCRASESCGGDNVPADVTLTITRHGESVTFGLCDECYTCNMDLTVLMRATLSLLRTDALLTTLRKITE